MKKQILLYTFMFLMLISKAQSGKSVKQAGHFGAALSAIVLDFKNNFLIIQGNELAGASATTTYASAICLPEALHCTIERYNSIEDKSASWQAQLFDGESYQDAVRIYKSIFKQVRTTNITGIDGMPVGFTGGLENPDENIRFTVSTLRLSSTDKQYKDLEASIELSSNMLGWEVSLKFYRKKADTEGNMIQ